MFQNIWTKFYWKTTANSIFFDIHKYKSIKIRTWRTLSGRNCGQNGRRKIFPHLGTLQVFNHTLHVLIMIIMMMKILPHFGTLQVSWSRFALLIRLWYMSGTMNLLLAHNCHCCACFTSSVRPSISYFSWESSHFGKPLFEMCWF